MKKLIIAIVSLTMWLFTSSFHSCVKDSANGQQATDSTEQADSVIAKELVYTNANCGYTVTLPEGFIAKNNLAKFEEMGETKIFQNHAINATIDFRVKEETGEAKAEIKRSSAILAADELKTLIKNEVTDNALTATWKDKDGTFNAVYNRIENGKKAIINFSYSAKNEAEFNAAIESVTNSFKLN